MTLILLEETEAEFVDAVFYYERPSPDWERDF